MVDKRFGGDLVLLISFKMREWRLSEFRKFGQKNTVCVSGRSRPVPAGSS